MDDQTARWLLSAIIQSIATIWAVFFSINLSLYLWLDKKYGKNRYVKEKGNGWSSLHKYIIDPNEAIVLHLINISMPICVVIGIISLYFFRNDFLIIATIILSLMSIVFLLIYIFMLLREISWS